MTEPEHAAPHHIPNYMAIFWWLLGLTVLEVAWVYLPHQRWSLIGGLLVLAVTKALLVALFFMHLKFERKSLGLIVASTLVLGMILLTVGIAEHELPRP